MAERKPGQRPSIKCSPDGPFVVKGLEILRGQQNLPWRFLRILRLISIHITTSSQEQPQWKKQVAVFVSNDSQRATVVGIESACD